MELILWRHAEAEEGVPDISRRLTGKGLKQAKSMAEWLNARLPDNTRVIVSPAERTQQTAAMLSRNFETNEQIAPGATAEMVLAAAGWPEMEGAVLIVGHQPTLGKVATLLISDDLTLLRFKTGELKWFSYKEVNGVAEPTLHAVVSPEIV